jgi:hypothetical protein
MLIIYNLRQSFQILLETALFPLHADHFQAGKYTEHGSPIFAEKSSCRKRLLPNTSYYRNNFVPLPYPTEMPRKNPEQARLPCETHENKTYLSGKKTEHNRTRRCPQTPFSSKLILENLKLSFLKVTLD